MENLLPTPPDEKSWIFCTYCTNIPVAAVKLCLVCEAFLCDIHLEVHSKEPEHVLCDPTTSMESRKCSIHKKILEYYCTKDSVCICVSCCLIGEHRDHTIQSLDDASENNKKKLRNVLQKLVTDREEMEKTVHGLQERGRKVQDKAKGEIDRVTALFRDLRRQLEDQEKRTVSEIFRQADQVSCSVSNLIRQLEIKKDELSKKMRQIEVLCNVTDPLTALQKSGKDDLCDNEDEDNEGREWHDKLLHDGGDLDVTGISHILHTSISNIITGVDKGISVPEAASILLDINTAGNLLHISKDRKSTFVSTKQNHPQTRERFLWFPQVISIQSFSSGQHYWEVDVGESERWRVGICYPSIARRGEQSWIGNNDKSWCLERWNNCYLLIHDSKWIQLLNTMSSSRVRIYLDYKAGQVSFYDLQDPIFHIHTFTATFTEPLHAALWLGRGCINICGADQDM